MVRMRSSVQSRSRAPFKKGKTVIIGLLKDSHPDESRTILNPDDVEKLIKLGLIIHIEPNLGKTLFSDEHYINQGAIVASNRKELLSKSDILCQIRKPSDEDISSLKKNSVWMSLLDPFNEKECLQSLAKQDIQAVSLDMIPRITRAQKMDILSSQASLTGYSAVILAAQQLQGVFPMMMTPAGTISPSRVFIIGAGVAGLQAIATAKRLGARVEAFDTRPVVEEQVQSLGAKFIKVDLGETGQTKDGYAKQLTDEQLAKQRAVMAKHCALADVIITTAQVFGKKAPLIVTDDMINDMSPGSVIVDLAVESGGNVSGSKLNEIVTTANQVSIIGTANFAGQVSKHATQMLSANITHFIQEFWNSESKAFTLNPEDEIVQGCLLTREGKVIHPLFAEKGV